MNMTKKYFPILVAKAGELAALSHLQQEIKNEICPVIQVLDLNYEKLNTFLHNWNFTDNEIFLDFSILTSNSSRDFENFFRGLLERGVNFSPVINHSDSADYTHCVHEFLLNNLLRECVIRCKNFNIESHRNQIIRDFSIGSEQISVIIDCGYITDTSLAISVESAISHISSSASLKQIIISAGSFPVDLGSIIQNSITHLTRFEWNFWNLIKQNTIIDCPIYYSDYGTKHPTHRESHFRGSCSIKYSTELEFVVFRGMVPGSDNLGNNQYIVHSRNLVKSNFYSGVGFSWADDRIHHYSSLDENNHRSQPGSSQTWVEISQNHHITLLTRLL